MKLCRVTVWAILIAYSQMGFPDQPKNEYTEKLKQQEELFRLDPDITCSVKDYALKSLERDGWKRVTFLETQVRGIQVSLGDAEILKVPNIACSNSRTNEHFTAVEYWYREIKKGIRKE